ncbi:MAG TPA: LysE family translocator [Streptosporangiaceae bacterium]|nr:LysE family translocator [Streptosporangiaceae bacterium]
MEVWPGTAQVIAFVTFSAVAAGTPGPGNALLAAVGANAGVRRGLPSLLGQVTGMGAMLFAVTLGLGRLLLRHPWVLQDLRWGGAALLGWMAWRIATAGPADGAADAPAGFGRMAAFQWANPKGWLVSVAAAATFMNQHTGDALGQAAFLAILFTLVALPSCVPWLAFGAALQRFLRTPRAWATFRWAMAGLLAASVILFVWPAS